MYSASIISLANLGYAAELPQVSGHQGEVAAWSDPLRQHEDDRELQRDAVASSSPAATAPGLRLGLDADVIVESQHQKLTEQHAEASALLPFYELKAEARHIVWDLPDGRLTDQIYGAVLTLLPAAGQRLGISYQHAPSPHFSYQDAYGLAFEQSFAAGLYGGATYELRRFPGKDDPLASFYLGLYQGEYHARAQVYAATGGAGALLLRVERSEGLILPGAWVAFGRGEALRPYLVQDGNQTYVTAGTKLGLAYGASRVYVYYEYQGETAFWQQTVGAGLTWTL